MQRKLKIISALVLMALVAFAAMGWLTFRNAEKHSGETFSVDNVLADIEVISSEPHSVMHPEARAKVREYLAAGLRASGGEPEICVYDTIAGVYCKFEPAGRDTSSSYLMLVAHLDSRFPEMTPHGQVCSYGAADDGYGLGVILEVVDNALAYSDRWSQGLKVLFTDAEERRLLGVRTALERDNAMFDNVGLVINVEARGVKGPALLFETSDGNSALMDLYLRSAVYPYTYSLTSTVYRFLPNYTDFTYLKPLFPGYNFSVIDNMHYYHNDNDNYSNVSRRSLAHYGAQIGPVVEEYLTSPEYARPDRLRSGTDDIVFTIPGLTTLRLSATGNYVLSVVVFICYIVLLLCYSLSGRTSLRKVLGSALGITLSAIAAAAAGTLTIYLSALAAGVPFSLTDLRYLYADGWISSLALILMAVIYIRWFVSGCRKSGDFVFSHLFGLLSVLMVVSAVLLFTIGENLFIILPSACVLAGLLFHFFNRMNIMSLPALLAVELIGVSFIYNLYVALTAGALGLIMLLAYIYLIMIVSLFNCYMNQRRWL
ncbi:MAG TPA: M28 family peptidase [Candidatus Coprenecus pullistercoris]|nr:M28 family peptidase [Candidatus Coprenecus pullistercoris]